MLFPWLEPTVGVFTTTNGVQAVTQLGRRRTNLAVDRDRGGGSRRGRAGDALRAGLGAAEGPARVYERDERIAPPAEPPETYGMVEWDADRCWW
jgi:hypothetical protein